MSVHTALLLTALCMPAGQPGGTLEGGVKFMSKDIAGQTPPPLTVADGHLLNAETPPDLATLRGHVVWVEFSFVGCPSCRAFLPYLIRWHEEMPELTIIGVDNGDRDTLARVEEHVRKTHTPFPVIHDENEALVNAYGVKAYPSAYLIGADGKVIWNGHPLPNLAKPLEAKIRDALADAKNPPKPTAAPAVQAKATPRPAPAGPQPVQVHEVRN